MQHIRNSVKGVFFLEHDSVPVATTTDFGEPIIDGSLCVDRNDDNLYILRSGNWTLIGLSSVSSNNIVEITYADLVNLYNSSELNPGQLYKFEYQTIHRIQNTSDINVGATETLICMALSEDKLSKHVWSEDYPQDLIYYDIEDDVAEDFVTSRPGFITYRKDTDKNNETWYDFRTVLFRRWKISTTLNDSWIAGTNFNQDEMILYNDALYKCTFDHTSTASFDNTKFIQITNNISTTYYNWDDTSIYIDGIQIYSNTEYQDYLTFDVSDCRNVHIGKPISSDSFNNITLIDSFFGTSTFCSDIKIGDGARNMVIKGAYLNIGNNCQSLLIGRDSGYLTIEDFVKESSIGFQTRDTRIGVNSSGVITYSAYNVDIEQRCTSIALTLCNSINIKQRSSDVRIQPSCFNISIGYLCDEIYISSSNSNLNIDNSVTNFNMTGSSNTDLYIGYSIDDISFLSGNNRLKIGSNSDNIVIGNNNDDTIIGSNCSDITLNDSIIDSIIGNNCSDIEIPSGNQKMRIGKDCSTLTIGFGCTGLEVGDSSNSLELADGCSWNRFGKNCSNIVLNTSCAINNFGDFNSNIELPIGSLNNTFINNYSNKTFTTAPQGLKVLVQDSNTVTYNNLFENVVANMIDSNDDIWYQTINTFGAITTVKME